MVALNSTTPQMREDRTIYRALMLLEKRLRAPGDTLSSPPQVRDYLRLLLSGEDREIFTVIFLDAQI
jgi:DNA repair protein RadC